MKFAFFKQFLDPTLTVYHQKVFFIASGSAFIKLANVIIRITILFTIFFHAFWFHIFRASPSCPMDLEFRHIFRDSRTWDEMHFRVGRRFNLWFSLVSSLFSTHTRWHANNDTNAVDIHQHKWKVACTRLGQWLILLFYSAFDFYDKKIAVKATKADIGKLLVQFFTLDEDRNQKVLLSIWNPILNVTRVRNLERGLFKKSKLEKWVNVFYECASSYFPEVNKEIQVFLLEIASRSTWINAFSERGIPSRSVTTYASGSVFHLICRSCVYDTQQVNYTSPLLPKPIISAIAHSILQIGSKPSKLAICHAWDNNDILEHKVS